MVTRRGWTAREDSRSDWISEIDLDGRMATRHDRALPHKRCDLVDSVRDLLIRRLARVREVVARRPPHSTTVGLLIPGENKRITEGVYCRGLTLLTLILSALPFRF